jgi:hypothetical protein
VTSNRDAACSVVAIAACVMACHDSVDPTPTGLASLTVAPATAPADGVTQVAVTAAVDVHLPVALWSVAFSSSAGIFTVSALPTAKLGASPDGLCTVYLQAPRDSATALVTATADTVARSATVMFQTAPVDSIDLEPAAPAVAAGPLNTVEISAHLLRVIGYPSPGVRVSFSATDTANMPLGTFTTPLPSDTTNIVTTLYSTPDSTYFGPVTITATVATGASGRTSLIVAP